MWPGRAARRGHSGHCPDYTTRPSVLHPRHSPGPLTVSPSVGSEMQLLETGLVMKSGKERDSGVRDHKALGGVRGQEDAGSSLTCTMISSVSRTTRLASVARFPSTKASCSISSLVLKGSGGVGEPLEARPYPTAELPLPQVPKVPVLWKLVRPRQTTGQRLLVHTVRGLSPVCDALPPAYILLVPKRDPL